MAFFPLYEHICSQFYYSPETTCDLLLQAWFSKTWKQSLEYMQESSFCPIICIPKCWKGIKY